MKRLFIMTLLMSLPWMLWSARPYDRVIARLNDELIMTSDLTDVLREKRGLVRVADPVAAADKEVMRALLDRTLLLDLARRSGVNAPENEIQEQVEAMIEEIVSHYPSKNEFMADVKEQYGSLDKFKQELARRATIDYRVGRAIASRFTITDTDVARFEEECRRKGQRPESYHLRRIAVAIDASTTGGSEAAMRHVKELLERASREGLNFAQAARRYSQIPEEAAMGGELGYLPADKLAPEVLRAVEGLEPGKVTPPLRAGNYACIFYVEAKRGSRSALYEKRFMEARESLLKELRRKATLTIYEPRLKGKVPEDYKSCLHEPARVAGQASQLRGSRPSLETPSLQGSTTASASSEDAPQQGVWKRLFPKRLSPHRGD